MRSQPGEISVFDLDQNGDPIRASRSVFMTGVTGVLGAAVDAIGAMNIGFSQLRFPLFGGFVLTEPSIPITHGLDPLGSWSTTLNTPNNPALIGLHVYFQAAYFDPGAPFGVTASYGLDMQVR